MDNNIIRGAIVFSAGAIVGGVGVYVGLHKKIYGKLEHEFEEAIVQYRVDWERMQAIKKPYSDPTEAVKALILDRSILEKPEPTLLDRLTAPGVPVSEARAVVQKIHEYGGTEDPEDPDLVDVVASGVIRRNAFDEQERTADKPYIIKLEEYMEDNLEDGTPLEKLTVTYYEGDDVLTDERDQMIPEIDETVGSINLTMFGEETKKYSHDENIVYVRNEKLRADFEIALNKGSYAAHIMGVDPEELEEADRRTARVHRMRDDE